MVVAVVRATEAGRSSIEAATSVVLEEAMRVVAMAAVVATARRRRRRRWQRWRRWRRCRRCRRCGGVGGDGGDGGDGGEGGVASGGEGGAARGRSAALQLAQLRGEEALRSVARPACGASCQTLRELETSPVRPRLEGRQLADAGGGERT
eukprot:5403292-Prymnesium_polylepis.1